MTSDDLARREHAHHPGRHRPRAPRLAEDWFAASDDTFATCPITERSLLRLLIREGQTATSAQAVLKAVRDDERHEFWPDSVVFNDMPMHRVLGHRQVTDSYLAQLTRSHRGRLVTFDQGLAELHRDVTDLLPTVPVQPSR